MPVFECTSRVTRRSLMNKSKDELATRVMELMEEIGTVRDRMAKVEADRADMMKRRSDQRPYEERTAALFEELHAAAKAALGEIPCGPEWLERLRSAVATTRSSAIHTDAAARGRMDALAQSYFEKVIRERDEAVARAESAEAAFVVLTPQGSEFYRRNPDRTAEREYIVDVPACVAYVRGRLDRMRASVVAARRETMKMRWPQGGSNPVENEIPVAAIDAEQMAVALVPLFAPVPTRDSDLPAVVSPCA
ncbi:hypothetical protein ACYQR9_21665 [Methylobacterium sp. CM6241]